ncbi:MAG: ABC transporter substrate-binding protein [Myxococcales bacterium]|nr:ABC transporter substrate-binding protein [Myxococcales bacterium]
MIHTTGWPRASALILAVALLAPVARADDPAPTRLIDRLHADLLGVMQEAEALGFKGRYERLAPLLNECFDLPFMAEKSVGRYWRTASEEDRARLLETFRRFIVSNYAGRFTGYSGQRFETLGDEPALRDTVLVRSRIVDPVEEPIDLDYRLRRVNGSWKIIDVYLNGTVSELALRRSEYSTLIQREGIGGLLAALDAKIADLASGSADES